MLKVDPTFPAPELVVVLSLVPAPCALFWKEVYRGEVGKKPCLEAFRSGKIEP